MVDTIKPDEISLADVARVAKVSLGTASRVMNGNTKVDASLRRRVVMSSRKLGFIPKVRRRQIGVITGRPSPGLPVGYTSVLTAMIMREAVSQKIGVELFDVESLDELAECHIDAAVCVVFDDRIRGLRDYPHLPVVTINHPMAAQGIHSVYTDHRGQGRLAAQHLVERGHERIGILQTDLQEWGTRERRLGCTEVMEAAGLTVDPSLTKSALDAPVYEILERWVRSDVTAILNFSEDTQGEVLHILSNILKLRIGKDISTITSEDLPIFQYFSPPQTVVRQPLAQLAHLAVQCVVERFSKPRSLEHAPGKDVLDRCFQGELVVRDSVADLRA